VEGEQKDCLHLLEEDEALKLVKFEPAVDDNDIQQLYQEELQSGDYTHHNPD